jgi:hypothetical protein
MENNPEIKIINEEQQEEIAEISVIENLISDLSQNRDELHDIILDIKKFRKLLDGLIPEKLDHRNKFLLEQRVKTIVQTIQTELNVRKQFDESIKLEVDLRTKTETDDNSPAKEQNEIRKLAKALEIFKNNKK